MEKENIKVLLIEDNPGDARLIEEELKDANGSFTTEHADRLSAGLERLARGTYDVVLLDLSLPDSHGIKTVTDLKAKAPDVPIVVLTGLEDEQAAMKAVRSGAQDYLVKGSVDGDRLARAMRYAIERKQATAELQDLRQQLAMSEKLSTLGALVSGLAQELRTSTTYITNTLYQIRQAIESAAEKNPALREVSGEVADRSAAAMEGIDRIDRLVRDLRGFTQGRAGEEERMGLEVPVSEAVDIFRATHRSRINVDADLQPAPPMALNKVQMQQVALNLLSNAVDAMPDGGTVRITVRPVEGGAELVVADEGTGLAPEARKRLFEPFFSTKTGSAGLGLPIAQRLVDAHHGTIKVESEAGRGTTFTVFLPARQAGEPETSG